MGKESILRFDKDDVRGTLDDCLDNDGILPRELSQETENYNP